VEAVVNLTGVADGGPDMVSTLVEVYVEVELLLEEPIRRIRFDVE